MDSFLNLYEKYSSASLWLVLRRVYSDAPLGYLILLWLLTALLFGLSGYYLLSENRWWISAVAVAYGLWLWCYMAAFKSTFAQYYRHYFKRIRYYGKHHQYVRYLIFRDNVSSEFHGDIDDAIKHLEIQFATEAHNPISLHPIASAIVATAISIIGASVTCAKLDTFVVTFIGLVVVWFWLWAYSSSTRTTAEKLKECHRFLLWLKDEPIVP